MIITFYVWKSMKQHGEKTASLRASWSSKQLCFIAYYERIHPPCRASGVLAYLVPGVTILTHRSNVCNRIYWHGGKKERERALNIEGEEGR